MTPAAFSLVNYQFVSLNFDLEDFSIEDVKIGIEPRGVYFEKDSSYLLLFKVILLNSSEVEIFNLKVVGEFAFDNVDKFENIPDYFYRNAIAILFPYVRSYISIVTTQANVGGVIIPTYNLTPLEHELRENTERK